MDVNSISVVDLSESNESFLISICLMFRLVKEGL